jgi:hypothetical protein
MAFDFGALAAGFSTGAAESIESRNKQIRNGATKELDQLVQEATAKEKGLRTERDTLTEQAKQLSTYANAQGIGFTKSQILGLIQQPPVAKKLIEDLNNKKDLRDVDFASIFKVTKPGTEMEPEEFARKKTSIAVDQGAGKPTPVVRGAFGFASPGVAQAEREFESVSGRTAAEVRGIARGRVDMGADFKPTVGTLDLSQFGNPESLSNVQNKLRDLMAAGEDLNSEKAKPLLAKLRADSIIKDMFDKEGAGPDGKPRTTAAINSVMDKSLRAALDPFVIKGVVRFDSTVNDYVPITGDADSIKNFMEHKNKLIQDQAKALGILDKDNKIIGGRNSADALLPYANIEDGKVVSWKSVVTPVATANPDAAVPKVGGGTAPVVASNIETPAKVILTPDGKGIDRAAMAKAYKPGQKIADSQGNIKTWNGMSLQ